MTARVTLVGGFATSVLAAALAAPLAAAPAAAAAPTNLDDFSDNADYAEFYGQEIEWSEEACAGAGLPDRPDRTYECAKVTAPLDWYDPSKGTIDVGIGRVLEYGDWENPENRRLLLSNPGGPGGNGINFGAVVGHYIGAAESHNGVGIDPRGIGLSTNLICPAPPADYPGVSWEDGDSSTFTWEQIKVSNQQIADYLTDCVEDQAGLVEYINSDQTARDFNLVRHLMGYETSDYYGVSYGTWLGSVMEKQFPNTYDRVVLDGNMNWDSGSMEKAFGLQAHAMQATNDRQLLPFLGRHDDVYGLGDKPWLVEQSIGNVRKAVLAGEFGDDITADMFDVVHFYSLYSQYGFDPFGKLVVKMRAFLDGDTELLDEIRAEIIAGNASSDTARSVFMTLPCADTENTTDTYARYTRNEADARNLPLIAPQFVPTYCAAWPHEPAMDDEFFDRPVSEVFMLQNEGDPATGYTGAWETRIKANGTVRMMNVDDLPGHGLPMFDSPCAWDATVDYLVQGNFPAEDVFCQAGPITTGEVNDELVYEFMNPASDANPLPRPFGYPVRNVSEPSVDSSASAPAPQARIAEQETTGGQGSYALASPEELAELREATKPVMLTAITGK